MTGRDVFLSALALIAEDRASAQVEDYERRAMPLINLLLAELRTRTSFFKEEQHMKTLASLDSELFADERIARYVLPCGLAARLLLEEDPVRAEQFYEDYEKGIAGLWKGRITPIKKVW